MFKPASVVRQGLWGVVGGSCSSLEKLQIRIVVERTRKRPAIEGDSPVHETITDFLDSIPKYVGTRETLTESGGTILQG